MDVIAAIWREHAAREYSEADLVRLFDACRPEHWFDLALCVLAHPAASRRQVGAIVEAVRKRDALLQNIVWGAWDPLLGLTRYERSIAPAGLLSMMGTRDPLLCVKAMREFVARGEVPPAAVSIAREMVDGLRAGRVYTPPEHGGFWTDYGNEPCMRRAGLAIEVLLGQAEAAHR